MAKRGRPKKEEVSTGYKCVKCGADLPADGEYYRPIENPEQILCKNCYIEPKKETAIKGIDLGNVFVTLVPIERIAPNAYNTNRLEREDQARLQNSIEKFGIVEPIVVRIMENDSFEIIGGEHRFKRLQKMGKKEVLCSIVNLDDSDAMLLSEVLNNLRGSPDKAKQSELYKILTSKFDEKQLQSVLPFTQSDIKTLIDNIQEAPAAAARAIQDEETLVLKISVTKSQADVISRAFEAISKKENLTNMSNAGMKGYAMELICAEYLSGVDENG